MANWSTNKFYIHGSKDNILAFLNIGLAHSNAECEGTVKEAFDSLVKNGKHFVSIGIPYEKRAEGAAAKIALEEGITMGTFRPIPIELLMYDTENFSEVLADKKEYFTEIYGKGSWYDWNKANLGCKWDIGLDNLALYHDKDDENYMIYFENQTPWSSPEEWCKYIKNAFNLDVFICASEESDAYNYYSQIDVEEFDCNDFDKSANTPKREDYDSDDEYCDAYFAYRDERINNMVDTFSDYVLSTVEPMERYL